MAELVGVISSGIAIGGLAAQAAKSIAKLKNLWDEVREAPEDIEELINEAHILARILVSLENEHHGEINLEQHVLRDNCLRYCRTATKKLQSLVQDLVGEIQSTKGLRRKWISGKFVLHKDRVKKYRARLKGAVRLLSLSEQCYARKVDHLPIY
jgi:hypothetical protein